MVPEVLEIEFGDAGVGSHVLGIVSSATTRNRVAIGECFKCTIGEE